MVRQGTGALKAHGPIGKGVVYLDATTASVGTHGNTGAQGRDDEVEIFVLPAVPHRIGLGHRLLGEGVPDGATLYAGQAAHPRDLVLFVHHRRVDDEHVILTFPGNLPRQNRAQIDHVLIVPPVAQVVDHSAIHSIGAGLHRRQEPTATDHGPQLRRLNPMFRHELLHSLKPRRVLIHGRFCQNLRIVVDTNPEAHVLPGPQTDLSVAHDRVDGE